MPELVHLKNSLLLRVMLCLSRTVERFRIILIQNNPLLASCLSQLVVLPLSHVTKHVQFSKK